MIFWQSGRHRSSWQGKVWLHQDNTDLLIADQLLEQGIPADDIVLGFHAPIMRADTEFAVG